MKTKEIDVWVLKECVRHTYNSGSWNTKESLDFNVKAKLIIEIPEKKIEITESEFDEAVTAVIIRDGYYCTKTLKKELGF